MKLLQAADQGFFQEEAEDLVGEEAEVDGADGGDGQDHVDGGGEGDGRGGGGVFARFAHVHGDDDFQIVVGADDAVDSHENGEPDQVGIYGGLEDIEFAKEACGDGQTQERKKKKA